MKAYTDIEQSKKLAEILPVESADMFWTYDFVANDINGLNVISDNFKPEDKDIPAWSLSALLYALPFPQLSKDNLGSGRIGWMVSAYPNNCRYDSCWHDNPIDACYELTLKLHEQKLL